MSGEILHFEQPAAQLCLDGIGIGPEEHSASLVKQP